MHDQPSKIRTYAELVRLPALPTLIADVLMAYWFVRDELIPPELFGTLLAASALLYLAGMVLNDVFDVEQDTRERPQRPIPSGRVSQPQATRFGFGLLLAGWVCALVAAYLGTGVRGALLGTGLAALIVAYDWQLKRTLLGPLAMGACRTLNILMVMSAATEPLGKANYAVAVGIGLYILGVTLFARREAAESHRGVLAIAAAIMLAAVGLLFMTWQWIDPDALNPILQPGVEPYRWQLLWAFLAIVLVGRSIWVIAQPTPALVQDFVRQSLMSLILFDAGLTFLQRGMVPALVVVALIIPATMIGRMMSPT